MASQLGTAYLIENAQAKLRWLGHSANDVSEIMKSALISGWQQAR